MTTPTKEEVLAEVKNCRDSYFNQGRIPHLLGLVERYICAQEPEPEPVDPLLEALRHSFIELHWGFTQRDLEKVARDVRATLLENRDA